MPASSSGPVSSTASAPPESGQGSLPSNHVPELLAALLPSGLPVLPGAAFAAGYLAVGPDSNAGGDWFDAISLANGSVALTVGSALGHGAGAAAAMSQMRTLLTELLQAEPSLDAAVDRVSAFAAVVPTLQGASMVLAVLDPGNGRLQYITCGSPPPLIVRRDGPAEHLASTGAGPLGSLGATPTPSTARLGEGDLALLYSSGLVDRPTGTIWHGMDELAHDAVHSVHSVAADAARDPRTDPADCLSHVVDDLLSRTGYHADVAVIAAQLLRQPIHPLRVQVQSEVENLRLVRDEFSTWLAAAGASSPDFEDLQLAVGEVLTNAFVHAYPPGEEGPIEFQAHLDPDGSVQCQITDHGIWKDPELAAESGGHGLMVASELTGTVRVSHPRAGGTVVTFRRALRRPPAMGSVSTPEHESTPTSEVPFRVTARGTATGGAAVGVQGRIDTTTEPEFSRRLLSACRGGTVSLTVDLADVSYLDRAGTWALHQLSQQLAVHQQALTLVVPPSGQAHPALHLAELAHQADPTADDAEPAHWDSSRRPGERW